jgi:hypothetical protein
LFHLVLATYSTINLVQRLTGATPPPPTQTGLASSRPATRWKGKFHTFKSHKKNSQTNHSDDKLSEKVEEHMKRTVEESQSKFYVSAQRTKINWTSNDEIGGEYDIIT